MKTRSLALIILVVAISLVSFGCSTKIGGTGTQSHFSYPNSNVKPLGKVSASLSKTSWLVFPTITEADVKSLMDKALAQKSGADLLINYSIDTKVTSIPFLMLTYMDVTIEGTAVSMDVGKQNLQELIKNYGY